MGLITAQYFFSWDYFFIGFSVSVVSTQMKKRYIIDLFKQFEKFSIKIASPSDLMSVCAQLFSQG
jgi:hypothetical protein